MRITLTLTQDQIDALTMCLQIDASTLKAEHEETPDDGVAFCLQTLAETIAQIQDQI